MCWNLKFSRRKLSPTPGEEISQTKTDIVAPSGCREPLLGGLLDRLLLGHALDTPYARNRTLALRIQA